MKKSNTGVLAIDAAVNAGKLRRPKLRMRRFHIDEISAVDAPAQEHALMTLMKSNTDPELTTFNKWMGEGAKVVSPDDAETITLELKGKRRTFFATEPAPNFPKIDPADLSPETREKLLAKYGDGTTEEEPDDMTTKKKLTMDDLYKIAEDGELAKAALQKADDDTAAAFEKRINEIRERDGVSARMAAEQAVREFPEEFEAWQTGSPVTAG